MFHLDGVFHRYACSPASWSSSMKTKHLIMMSLSFTVSMIDWSKYNFFTTSNLCSLLFFPARLRVYVRYFSKHKHTLSDCIIADQRGRRHAMRVASMHDRCLVVASGKQECCHVTGGAYTAIHAVWCIRVDVLPGRASSYKRSTVDAVSHALFRLDGTTGESPIWNHADNAFLVAGAMTLVKSGLTPFTFARRSRTRAGSVSYCVC